jgi:hypothetical protein
MARVGGVGITAVVEEDEDDIRPVGGFAGPERSRAEEAKARAGKGQAE